MMQNNWWSCEGHRRAESSRRALLKTAALSLGAWTGSRSALADLALSVSPKRGRQDVLVTIFLRGGADGLNVVAPFGEDAYYRNRPNLSIAKPQDRRVSEGDRLLDLNGFFGLNPALGPLMPAFHAGQLAIVHACGSQDASRSHFEAMAAVERGLAAEGPGPSSGWLARHLASTESSGDSPLRAIAFGGTLPDSLRGAANTVALESITDFQLETPNEKRRHFQDVLKTLYGNEQNEVAHAGQETLAVLDSLRKIDPAQYKPSNGATYPETDLGRGLMQTACVIRADLGLEVAALDRGGWDTHFAQGSTVGILSLSLDDLGRSIAAFTQDLGSQMNEVTVLVMTEFGRRVAENSSLGTDHGRAGVMFILGGGTRGGKVYTDWPGLEERDLDETGDLRVTTDYRDVLCEVLAKRTRGSRLSSVFPNFVPKPLGWIDSAPTA